MYLWWFIQWVNKNFIILLAIDAILMCFLHDEESCKGGEPKFCPSTLRDFFDKSKAKKDLKE